MAPLRGSPVIDAGNPSGRTEGQGKPPPDDGTTSSAAAQWRGAIVDEFAHALLLSETWSVQLSFDGFMSRTPLGTFALCVVVEAEDVPQQAGIDEQKH